MSNVFVIHTNKHPLNPVHPGLARRLLSSGQAAVFRRYPFTIILKREVANPQVEPRASNLTLACQACNVKKGTQLVADFLKEKPEVLARVLTQATAPLKDAASVNAARWQLYQRLCTLGLPIECGTGGRTKYNRTRLGLPKAHWIDAACVGASTPEQLCTTGITPLLIAANGHGSRQMCRMDKYGFPRTRSKQARRVKGFQTGDLVRAVVTVGNKVGTYVGRVAVRKTGSFNITTRQRTAQSISHRYCTLLQRSGGYSYQIGEAA